MARQPAINGHRSTFWQGTRPARHVRHEKAANGPKMHIMTGLSASHPASRGMPDGCRGMFAAADVCYLPSGGARAAAVVGGDTAFSAVQAEWTVLVPEVLPYRPGEFFLRELPPLRAVLAGVRDLGLLVIDGYVDLDPGGRPGLGAHVHAAFGVPVIGVAKIRFRTASHAAEVLRGSSAWPLFVTAAGMPLAQAANLVRRMAGPFRLPDALRRVDALARTGHITLTQPVREASDQ